MKIMRGADVTAAESGHMAGPKCAAVGDRRIAVDCDPARLNQLSGRDAGPSRPNLIACDHCDGEIDVDTDPKCFVESPFVPAPPFRQTLVEVVCEACREKAYDRQTERAMEDQS